MYRINDQQFPTYEDAEDWAKDNIGGCYTIVPLSWCERCRDWVGYETTENGQRLCEECKDSVETR